MRVGICIAVLGAALAGLAGCVGNAPVRPGETTLGSRPVILRAQVVGNVMVVEAKEGKLGICRFVVDTGSSVTLVSPDLAAALGTGEPPDPYERQVKVRSSEGGSAVLDAVLLSRIELGGAHFLRIPALVFDCSDLSSQFGMRIDGILGYPFFRYVVLTLDYPGSKLVLRSRLPEAGPPGAALLFSIPGKTPQVPVRIGEHRVLALLDSGSSAAVDINLAQSAPKFAFGPVEGPTVSTLAGDLTSKVGRLAEPVHLGPFEIAPPIAETTQEMTSLGGAVLSHFQITFDQEHDEVYVEHDPQDRLVIPSLRTTGLSFSKTPAYWKVAGVVPGSPADVAGVKPGDLVARINDEPVENWDVSRYEKLVAEAPAVSYTFIEGSQEIQREVAVGVLVP